MIDLVKRARALGDVIFQTTSLTDNERKLPDELADEIERLRNQRDHNAAVALSAKKAVIEDMRESLIAKKEKCDPMDFHDKEHINSALLYIDAYAKERGIE